MHPGATSLRSYSRQEEFNHRYLLLDHDLLAHPSCHKAQISVEGYPSVLVVSESKVQVLPSNETT